MSSSGRTVLALRTVRQLLDMRNFMDTMRSTGVDTGGPPAFSHADRQNFANQLDRHLAKALARR